MRQQKIAAIRRAARSAGYALKPDILNSLAQYLSLLQSRGASLNLVAELDESYLVERHVLDSLALLAILPPRTLKIIDVGSGAGFPGVILKVLRPDDRVDLMEARKRRAEFLQEVATRLELDSTVFEARAEEKGRRELRECYDMAVARALGSPPVALELILPLVAVGGLAVLMLGPRAGRLLGEIDALSRPLGGRVGGWLAYKLPDERGRLIAWIYKENAGEQQYPRSSARIRKEGRIWEERVGWNAGRKVNV